MPTGPINLPTRNNAKYDPARLCVISFPRVDLGAGGRKAGVYLSGALFAAGWWVFFDACTLSANMKPPLDSPFDPVPIHVRFTDWIPGLCSTAGMIIVNLIDKKRLISDGSEGLSLSGEGVAWKARLLLFMGFALLAGGLAGSITVLVLKYIIPDWGVYHVTYWGVANVLQNLAIMLCTVTLWITQSTEVYEYHLT
ncbi:hypothetical protein O181_016925 [Austropuccinia psidii MF-1]|uniref:Uncharacterized protein n=1 Tax=Austropuccinia psidii MF-1 TaxID=1389203 RepID=A0A9Q3C6U7_9BASI|nr:hypothetical protein [Austropuccinia psidii MF-1]